MASFALPGGGAFTWSLPDLGSDGFSFAPDDYFIKADSPLASLYEYAFAGDYVAFASDWIGTMVFISGEPLRVSSGTPIPEPGTGAFLGLAMFGAAVYMGMRDEIRRLMRRGSADHRQ